MPSPPKKNTKKSKSAPKPIAVPEPTIVRGNYIGKNYDPNFAAKFYKKSVAKNIANIRDNVSSKDIKKLGELALLGGSIAGIIFLLDRAAAKARSAPVDFVQASVDTPLSPSSKGYRMLAKKGYVSGGRSPIKPGSPNVGFSGLGY
jgi:hypothetical protein